jgi:hypothetical protein
VLSAARIGHGFELARRGRDLSRQFDVAPSNDRNCCPVIGSVSCASAMNGTLDLLAASRALPVRTRTRRGHRPSNPELIMVFGQRRGRQRQRGHPAAAKTPIGTTAG